MTTPGNHGELVSYSDKLPVTMPGQLEPSWESPLTALQVNLPGVYLGRIVGRDGWNAGFKDNYEQVVPDAGFIAVVSQSSAGGTYLAAKEIEGYKLEALNPDASSRRSMWRGVAADGKVSVDSDWGKMGTVKLGESWSGINFGNPGVRSGIVRVTNPDGNQHHYVVGADFSGQPDDWRVQGSVCEVWPNDTLQLMLTPRQLSGSVLDPSLISSELVATKPINARTIDKLSTAFEHAVPDVHILHAGERSSKAARTFTDVTLDLLIEIAKNDPAILDGTEDLIDELGRRARLISHGRNDAGFLNRLDTDEENRVRYLEAVRSELAYYSSNSDRAHSFTGFTRQALDVLTTAVKDDKTFNISEASPLVQQLEDIFRTDQQVTDAACDRRAEALRHTIFNPNWHREGMAHKIAIPGQKVELDLNNLSPLLTAQQTYEAFFREGRTDAGSKQSISYTQPTLAIVEIGGTRMALVDASTPRVFYGETSKRSFGLLKIVDQAEDPRYGLRITERNLNFGGPYDKDIQVIDTLSDTDGQSYLSQQNTDITVEFDDEANKLVIISAYRKAGVIACSDGMKALPWQAGDNGSIEARQKVRSWQKAVSSVEKDTTNLRQNLEQQLTAAVERGHMSPDEIARRTAEIEAIIARGPRRYHTFNGYRGDKWHRDQAYNVTVDSNGNIWGDFEAERHEFGITGKPLPAGRHLLHQNPTL